MYSMTLAAMSVNWKIDFAVGLAKDLILGSRVPQGRPQLVQEVRRARRRNVAAYVVRDIELTQMTLAS